MHLQVQYQRLTSEPWQVTRVLQTLCGWHIMPLTRLTQKFSRLQYPVQLPQSAISNFVTKEVYGDPISTRGSNVNEASVRIVLPFKDQRSANSARRHFGELDHKIRLDIRRVYTSRKIGHEIKPRENKPPIINQQRVVYYYKCGLCYSNHVRYTCWHLYQCVTKDRLQSGIILKSNMEQSQMTYWSKSKFHCLIYEMILIKRLKPTLSRSPALQIN